MTLNAVNLKKRGRIERGVPLWTTAATSTGTSGDLDRVFPVLVVAVTPYIATETDDTVEVELQESDGRLLEIKGETEEVTDQRNNAT